MTELQRRLRPVHPAEDRLLPDCFLAPEMFDILLDARSTLVSAPAGYGKSTLALMGKLNLTDTWLSIPYGLWPEVDGQIQVLLQCVADAMWQLVESSPQVLSRMGSRLVALKYFFDQHLQIDLDYLLERLQDDHPESHAAIEVFSRLPLRPLFRPGVEPAIQLETLCDCLTPIGLRGVMVWIDVPGTPANLAETYLSSLRSLFDSVSLMRRRYIHFKCLAPPDICDSLMGLRSVVTLSVERLPLLWDEVTLCQLVDRRLQVLAHEQPGSPDSLEKLLQHAPTVKVDAFTAFLRENSEVNSPVEWLALAGILLDLAEKKEYEHDTDLWLKAQYTYCAERLKIRMDAQGMFWRGKRLIEGLTPRKSALYPLVKYLYENQGYHSSNKLIDALGVEMSTQSLQTNISRIRHDYVEPKLVAADTATDSFIYLVSDPGGGGYALQHTE